MVTISVGFYNSGRIDCFFLQFDEILDLEGVFDSCLDDLFYLKHFILLYIIDKNLIEDNHFLEPFTLLFTLPFTLSSFKGSLVFVISSGTFQKNMAPSDPTEIIVF